MHKLEQAFLKLDRVTQDKVDAIDAVKQTIAVLLADKFSKSKDVSALLSRMEDTTDWSFDGCEYYRYVGLESIPTRELEYFSDWVADYGYIACLESGELRSYAGDCIIIDPESGAVYQNSERIIDASEYKARLLNGYTDGDRIMYDEDDDDTRRNALIEAYMERTGCFPDVLSHDRHGNIFQVNTQPAKGT